MNNSVIVPQKIPFSRRFDYYLGSKLFSELSRDGAEMVIPDRIRKCVAYLGFHTGLGNAEVFGTCFFVSQKFQHLAVTYYSNWCVTAAHVIHKIRGIRQDLGDEHGKMFLRTNLKSGGTIDLPLIASDWKFHDNPAFDVAMCKLQLEERDDHLSYPVEEFVTSDIAARNQIGIGTDLFVGLFDQHVSDLKNVPILRVGNIAAMPDEIPVKTEMGDANLYLVEARSRGGLSGSPVFTYNAPLRALGEHIITIPSFNLLGLLHGHFDESNGIEKFNAGIAMVTPIQAVNDILNHPDQVATRSAAEAEIIAANPSGATMD